MVIYALLIINALITLVDTLDRHASRCSHCSHQTETGTVERPKLDCSNSNTSILYTLVQLCLLPFSCCFNKQKIDIQRTSSCVLCKNEQLTPKSKQPIQMELVPLPWMQHEGKGKERKIRKDGILKLHVWII